MKINPYIDYLCVMYNVERTKGIDSIVEYMVKHMVLIIERIRERTGIY